MPTPTDEQTAAADRFHAGDHLALQAGAGTGKTSTLALLAHGTRRRGRYIAYNKAIAQEAASRFPSTVACKTAHALAYAAIGHRYRARLNSPRQPSWKTGHHLGITKTHRIGDRDLSPRALSYATLRTVTRFCHSADPALTDHHVPRLRNLEDAGHHRELTALVLPFARTAWADLQNPDTGAVRFDHDHYLKIWALTEPGIPADFLLLDEAQDTNPVVEQVFNAQRDHAQLVMVGDSAQAIYQWRGARDIMTAFRGTALTLSQSFRFGPDLATEANRWLSIATAPLRLAGTETIPTTLGPVDQPDAILCRTNVGAMREVMQLLDTDHRVALTGEANPCEHSPAPPTTSEPADAPSTPNCCSSPPGETCRTTPRTTPRDETSSRSSTSSTPTEPAPSSTPFTASTPKAPPTSPSRPPTSPKGGNGQASKSPTTSPHPATPTRKTPTGTLSPPPSTKPKHASPTSPSPAPATCSTWAACHGSTTTPTERPRHSPFGGCRPGRRRPAHSCRACGAFASSTARPRGFGRWGSGCRRR